jgi:hypothetical protein
VTKELTIRSLFFGATKHNNTLSVKTKHEHLKETLQQAILILLEPANKLKVLFYPTLPDFRISIDFWKAPMLRPLALLKEHIDAE